jgi:hypothetical protein
MFVVQCVAMTVFVAFISMPLLTELVSSEDGFCYRHGAPNGAVRKPAPPILLRTAENQNLDLTGEVLAAIVAGSFRAEGGRFEMGDR